jgi:adenylate cyclase
MAATRRLSAILAADVAGYSRLMGADEEGTLARLNTHRRDLIDPKIRQHRGRIVKTTVEPALPVAAGVVRRLACRRNRARFGVDRKEPVKTGHMLEEGGSLQ